LTLRTGKNVDALEVILRHPPLGAKSQAVKVRILASIAVLVFFINVKMHKRNKNILQCLTLLF
jgi:hypothetical protein